MKTTYRWLREYCDFTLSPQEVAERLTMSGLEVEALLPVGEDWSLDVEVTTNRPDLLGTLGIAREIAALTRQRVRLPEVNFPCGTAKVHELTSVDVLDPDLCPRYTARVITGVKIGPSPAWMRERLEAVGLRPINNVVDATNYVMMECGQPLHAFDFDKLQEHRIVVRRARAGEKIILIDGSTHTLSPSMLVIADSARPVAIAGVMGGLETEVTDRTKNILLESAWFEPTQVRRTSRALGVASDASYRFERGVDPVCTEWASRRTSRLILEMAGGEAAEGVVDVYAKPFASKRVTLRLARVRRLLGTPFELERAAEILEALGFEVIFRDQERIDVLVPPWRATDVYREADLIEEVARIEGYHRIPDRTALRIQVGRRSTQESLIAAARNLMVGMGYSEVITSSFYDAKTSELDSLWTKEEAFGLINPVRQEENRLRRSLLPSLLSVKKLNLTRGIPRAEIFEIGKVYLPRPGEKLPEERTCLALLEEDDLLALKGAVEALLERFGLAGQLQTAPCAHPFFRPPTGAWLMLKEELLGVIGEPSDHVAELFDLRASPCVGEINLDLLSLRANLQKRFVHLPAYPSVSRDIALVVDEAVTWGNVEKCVREAGVDILEEVRFFDLYRGSQVPPGKKSLAFTLVFRSPERTLRHEEVDAAEQRILHALSTALGGVRR